MGQKVSCEECGAIFATKKILSKHISRTHKVVEKIKCLLDNCNYSAARKDYFLSHMKTHKDLQPEELESYIVRIKAMKNLPW
jgi:hypothetical protein